MNADYLVLKDDLRAIGVREGDSILIHSSYKSMGGIEGGIKTLIDALLAVIGDKGTLIAPTLTFRDVTVENPVVETIEDTAKDTCRKPSPRVVNSSRVLRVIIATDTATSIIKQRTSILNASLNLRRNIR